MNKMNSRGERLSPCSVPLLIRMRKPAKSLIVSPLLARLPSISSLFLLMILPRFVKHLHALLGQHARDLALSSMSTHAAHAALAVALLRIPLGSAIAGGDAVAGAGLGVRVVGFLFLFEEVGDAGFGGFAG